GLADRGIVRVGATVRRPWGRWTPSVHGVLRHLAAVGFRGAPRPLGRDEAGREVVSYQPGEESGWRLRAALQRAEGAFAVGDLARRLRLALASYRCPAEAVWQLAAGAPVAGQQLQHGDLGPWNVLWTGERSVGIIDWDLAGPDDPLTDTAFAAWFTVPFLDDERAAARGFTRCPLDRQERLDAFCVGAGVARTELVAAVLDVQARWRDRIRARSREGREPWVTLRRRGVDQADERDRRWTARAFAGEIEERS
ncbi:MAG: phosphotransferase, partial [Candidatus Dormiibacterota bacterium]